MSDTESSRRKFLAHSVTGVSTAWIAANWPAAVRAAEAARQGGSFTFFKQNQAAEIDAMSAQIFPTTDTPGAREAQVVYFIDLGLMTFARDKQDIYAKGFEELKAKVGEMFPGSASFAALSREQQIKLLTAIEKSAFFRAVRDHTIMGMFAAPQHGGNYNQVGWSLIGFKSDLNFKEPFGYYDR
jgi:gluconate 2-dehydrogenase gamma chain